MLERSVTNTAALKWTRVKLVPLEGDEPLTARAEATAAAIRRAQGVFAVSVAPPVPLPDEGSQELPPERAFAALAAIPREPGELVIGLMDARLEGNLFGARDDAGGHAVASSYGWGFLTHLAVEGFAMFQVTAYLVRLNLGPAFELHDETRGCMQDKCDTKSDFALKLLSLIHI